MTTCASFDPNNLSIISFIKEPDNKDEIIKCIKKVIPQHTGIAHKERRTQYEKEKMFFYLAREDLMDIFTLMEKDKQKEDNINKEIQNKLLELSSNFPIKLEKYYPEFEKFISDSILILASQKKDNQKEIIKSTFNQLWDKLTTFTSFKDSEQFIDSPDKSLFYQIMDLNLNFKEMGCKIYLEELESLTQDENPLKIKMPQDTESIEIQKLILEGLENE
jgi:hypothetical protein